MYHCHLEHADQALVSKDSDSARLITRVSRSKKNDTVGRVDSFDENQIKKLIPESVDLD